MSFDFTKTLTIAFLLPATLLVFSPARGAATYHECGDLLGGPIIYAENLPRTELQSNRFTSKPSLKQIRLEQSIEKSIARFSRIHNLGREQKEKFKNSILHKLKDARVDLSAPLFGLLYLLRSEKVTFHDLPEYAELWLMHLNIEGAEVSITDKDSALQETFIEPFVNVIEKFDTYRTKENLRPPYRFVEGMKLFGYFEPPTVKEFGFLLEWSLVDPKVFPGMGKRSQGREIILKIIQDTYGYSL